MRLLLLGFLQTLISDAFVVLNCTSFSLEHCGLLQPDPHGKARVLHLLHLCCASFHLGRSLYYTGPRSRTLPALPSDQPNYRGSPLVESPMLFALDNIAMPLLLN